MVDIKDEPNSKHPYYTTPDKMQFCYFVVHYKNGNQFAQYEQLDDGRFVAHHWPEIKRAQVETFEAWGMRIVDGFLITECLKSIDVTPDMALFFKYRVCQHLSLNLKTRKALFGYTDDGEGNQEIWEIDKNFNVREHMMEEK